MMERKKEAGNMARRTRKGRDENQNTRKKENKDNKGR